MQDVTCVPSFLSRDLAPPVIIALTMAVSGCASLAYRAPDVRGTLTQQVEVTSEPAGAAVRLNGVIVGVTPARVAIRRKQGGQTLTFEKEGYGRIDVPLKRGPSAATFGNAAFSALALNPLNGPDGLSDNPWSRSQQVSFAFILPAVGIGIDMATGAAYAFPSRVHVDLNTTRVERH